MGPENKVQIHQVQTSAALLMNITNDLLDFSKLESGRLQITTAPMYLESLTSSCLSAVKQDAGEKGIKLVHTHTSTLPLRIMGDLDRLRQILINLLDNAIKFCTTDGMVCLHVSLVDEESMIQFQVSDTGIGIEAHKQAFVFDKFRQTHTSGNYGGTGLGLAICRGLVEVMEGRIWVESEWGVGSTFSFVIPLRTPDLTTCHNPLDEDLPAEPSVATKSLKILVAEDNKVNQRLVRSMLQRLGHTVTVAENGKYAVDQVKRERPDLILMDHMMPEMDGCQATKIIRGLGYSKEDLPIVGLTASFQRSELNHYLEIGMNDCLGKPVKLRYLKEAIVRAASDR